MTTHGQPGAYPGITPHHITPMTPAADPVNADTILASLADAQRNLKAWEGIVADLKAQLSDAVASGTIALEDNKIISDGYQFIRASRTTWTYPPSVLTLETALKQQQQISQLNGTATAKTLQFWTLKPQEP